MKVVEKEALTVRFYLSFNNLICRKRDFIGEVNRGVLIMILWSKLDVWRFICRSECRRWQPIGCLETEVFGGETLLMLKFDSVRWLLVNFEQ